MFRPKLLTIGSQAATLNETEWREAFASFHVVMAENLPSAAELISAGGLDCVLVTGRLPEIATMDVLDVVQSLQASLPVIVWDWAMGAAEAVRLIRAGAHYCIGHLDSIDALRDCLENAAEEHRSRQRKGRAVPPTEPWRSLLVGESAAMLKVFETVRLVGPRRCSVLITGETGTGKEMAAKAVHMASPRAGQPMVAINCSALPENLLEAELFGHTKGAFTGAINTRIGRFEQANKGTLFLDEVGDMPLELQAKLLRVLQERVVQRLGSSEDIPVDVRVIAATNVGLADLVRQGKFRADLFYRLNVVPLHMPSLESRASDIPLLVGHFVQKICKLEGLPLKTVSPEAMNRLSAHGWPGNVRQLENAVEMAVALSGDREVLYAADFGLPGAMPSKVVPISAAPLIEFAEAVDFETAVGRFERAMLENALTKTAGNKTAAAELLGLKRTTLIMKLRSFESLSRACAG